MKEDLCFMGKTEITHELLAYLTDHPDAQDTLEGILQWWLLERKIKYEIGTVKETLTELRDKGLLLEHESKDSQIHYRLNRDKLSEIQSLLKQE